MPAIASSSVQFEVITIIRPASESPLLGPKTTVFLEVEAPRTPPNYAGNLDIMTSAAIATADVVAEAPSPKAH